MQEQDTRRERARALRAEGKTYEAIADALGVPLHTAYQWAHDGRFIRPRRPLVGRLESRSRLDDNGCWVWQGSLTRFGYGRINIEGHIRLAHRVCYELLRGPVAAGLVLDHLCRNPACINPDHLEPVTDAENIRRGLQGTLKTHCANGHPWVPENMAYNGVNQAGNPAWCCVICRHRRERARRAA